MEGGQGPRLRDFLSGSLATWALGLAELVGEVEEPSGTEEEEAPLSPEKRFLWLSDGALLLRVLEVIAPGSRGGPRRASGHDGPEACRVWNLSQLWTQLRDFYQEELQLLVLWPPPDLQTLGFDPLSEEAVEGLESLLRLLLGASVQCEHRELFICHIQGLSLEVQSDLAAAIQEVTQPGAGVVLTLAGPEPGELAPSELEMLSRSLMATLSRLARERDLGAQRLVDLLLQRRWVPLLPEAPARAPTEGPSHHLALQLANAKAQLRRLRQELEEKAELLLDSQAEVQGLEAEIRRLRQEAQALSGQAKRAELYHEEVEALRQRAGRLSRLQEELGRCRERLQAAEACKSQLEEERVLSGALQASKALLEEQLEAARERCARLHEAQRENLLLRARLGEAHTELDSLRHQVNQLAEENVELELELCRSLQPPLNSPVEAPLPRAAPSLQDEVREAEAGQLRTLERENQELRGLLQVLQRQQGDQSGESVLLVLDGALRTPLGSDHNPHGLVCHMGDQDPQLAPPASDSHLEGSAESPQASDSRGEMTESPFQAAVPALQTSHLTLQESDAGTETQESLEKTRPGAPLQSPTSEAPHQGPEIKIEVQQLLGGENGETQTPQKELVLETQGLRQEAPERKRGSSELSRCELLEKQETVGQELAQSTRQTEARGHERWLEGMVRELAPPLAQQTSEGAPDARAWEGQIPGEALGGGVSEQEALREEVAQLRTRAAALEAELEAQARRLEARGAEVARLSEELAKAQRAEAEAHREAEAHAQEQSRLREAVEAAGRELEAASQEREALAEALAAAGRERRQWEREGPRLRARAEAAEERVQALESQGQGHLEEAEQERQEKQALSEELEKAMARGQELGSRLEHLQQELEQAAQEREKFLQEQENQQQRYQGLEQRLEAELQAAATSKEEALMELKSRALKLEEELLQLRQGPVGLGPEGHSEPQIAAVQGRRLIEVERNNATLVAEKAALQGQLQHLEGQLGSLQGRAQELLLQSQRAQEHSSRLQAEKSVLELQGQELHQKLGVLEEEVLAARQAHEEARGQQQALLRDHEALVQLQRRQEAELEGLLGRHRDLKANMRALELAHRELQGRHEQLQAQRANVEAQEVALLAERERLMQDGHRQRGMEEELRRLQSEHDRAQMLLAEVSRERGELQGERGELKGRLARLELERVQLEVQSQKLRESNQQLDLSACRLATQCELLTELRSTQEEENRQLLAEVQALSRENRELLERSLESRDHLHREQREYLDQLNTLRREKQKLVEKIMDQYRVLEPGPLPRTKKGSWLADKGPLHRHPCAGPRAPSAYERPWLAAGSGGNSVPGSPRGEALSHSVQGTPRGRDSASAVQAPWEHLAPTAKVWNGMAPPRPPRNMKQMSAERASRSRNRRNVLSPRPSASDTVGSGSLEEQPSHRWSISGGPRQLKGSGDQGIKGESLDRESWAPKSSTAHAGVLGWSLDQLVDRGDGWPPRVAPFWSPGSAVQPMLRRRALGDPPAEVGWQEWPRKPATPSRLGAKAHSPGSVA
ncbi:PREDICTED: coiled-coil domain-containing protein 88B isoform X2 [Chinchilla lanigera]|uniref:coiled-coil domain-containing protein 88B isoform X2 n=1 Tax=Chinchilla lanigera TaxID=34839 RepID=UPI000698BBE6|nr:PREDICTED: coiled-coil domain-containing protein 88B isoform X2 [Chinchilla lanigera]